MTELYQYKQVVGILYTISTGRIMHVISTPENMIGIQMTDDVGFIEAPRGDYSNKLVKNGKIVEKAEFEIKQDVNKFKNIPIGTVATVQGGPYDSYIIEDGEIEFIFDIGGYYEVVFDHPEYISTRMDFTI